MIMNHLNEIALPQNILLSVVLLLQGLMMCTVYGQERKDPASYSKFAANNTTCKDMIPSRRGMLIIYGPATIVCAAFAFLPMLLPSTVVAPSLFLLFLKRVLEVKYLHKYSGTLPKRQAIEIGSYYALSSCLIASSAVDEDSSSEFWRKLGSILFQVGFVGNFYHHYLLSTLRKGDEAGTKKYVTPTGGLFSMVAAPHYMFELIAWYGIACIAQQANAFAVAMCMTMYLFARARNQFDWNAKTFSKQQWDPATKTAIVPFLF